MGVCKRYTKVAYTVTGTKQALFTRLRCKQWSCDECAKTNAWIWRQHLQKKLPEVSQIWWFVTLTAPRDKRSMAESLYAIRVNLDRLFKRIKRVFGAISYVRVYEKHPTSNAVHVHLLMAGLTPYVAIGANVKHQPMAIGCYNRTGRNGVWAVKTWFKKTCNDVGMGYICDVQKIEGDPKNAMWYVTKYLTKGQQDIPEKGLRHVQTSSDIGSMKYEDASYEWTTAPYIIAKMFDPNTKITDINTGATIDNSYWEVHDVYPWDD